MDISKLKNEVPASTVKDSSQVSKNKGLGEKTPTQSIRGTEIGGLGGSSMEKVSWSPDASLLAHGFDVARNSPEVRSEKVAELKAAVKNGTYKVNAQAVAEKMLESEIQDKTSSRKS